MREVKVNVKTVLERVKANRAEHRKIVEESWVGYIATVTAELEKMRQSFKEGNRFAAVIALQPPQDHTADYDAIIDMMESSVDTDIMLEQNDFRAYVRDEWAWMRGFLASNSRYSNTATQKMSQ